ncbi:MAG: DnaB-like helicase terminal domain [Polyangiaceae bacterium]|nr:DnaB-like helicase terminal domain [Polyangiaceae bacterium]
MPVRSRSRNRATRLGFGSLVEVSASTDRLPKVSGVAAVSLAAMQVDVTTHLGAVGPATSTGLPSFDLLLGGGLRSGTLLALSGAAGSGRTSVALALAYLAARARAGVVVAGAAVDPTEIVARLAARALHREYPEARTSYGEIWSGQAWAHDASRRPIADAIDTVMKKVGSQLHLFRGTGLETTQALADCVAQQWARSERVVLVVDDVEGFLAMGDGGTTRSALVNGSFEARITQVGYELRRIAEQGACVIATVLGEHLPYLSPAATVAAELEARPLPERELTERLTKLGARSLLLRVTKNRVGSTGEVPLTFVPGAATLQETRA